MSAIMVAPKTFNNRLGFERGFGSVNQGALGMFQKGAFLERP
jgi:hypothetical protein